MANPRDKLNYKGDKMNPKELVSSTSHFFGAFLSAIALILFIQKAESIGMGNIYMVSVIIFGISLIALYSCSGTYHLSKAMGHMATSLRKLDHAMIYVLIAGSYMPICFLNLPLKEAVKITAIIWTIAIIGIIAKLFWITAPNWVSASIYILMGWAMVVDFGEFWAANQQGMIFIALGGITYTVGGIIYAVKKPCFSKYFGFHEFFHIFVLLGSFFHFYGIYFYMIS
ncbi:MAG: hemolysin III family protein [Eubacteriales bacterium]